MITSAEEFVQLRTSDACDDYLRSAHEEAPVSVWLDVINQFPHMKEWVVHNKSVPLEILQLLVSDSNPNVRAAIANKRKLNAHLFDVLSKDTEEIVRHRLAYNKKAPKEIIARLAQDDSAFVRAAAINRLKATTSN